MRLYVFSHHSLPFCGPFLFVFQIDLVGLILVEDVSTILFLIFGASDNGIERTRLASPSLPPFLSSTWRTPPFQYRHLIMSPFFSSSSSSPCFLAVQGSARTSGVLWLCGHHQGQQWKWKEEKEDALDWLISRANAAPMIVLGE